MEEAWIQRIRKIAREQSLDFVDAKIVNHRMQMTRRDGQVVDAGPIKVKPAGSIITPAYDWDDVDHKDPDMYVTKDGAIWQAASSEGKYQGGTLDRPNSGCWTGDRFLVPIYVYTAAASVLQSRDGGTWSIHPDSKMFNNATNGNIYGMDALGTGLVLAVGQHLGEDETSSIAISRDFGETWGLINDDPSIFPFYGILLYGVTIKSDYEWVVSDGSGIVWYTRDGGLRWSEVEYPDEFQLENTYASGIRYFNGYWWFFGTGEGTDEWDTVLIKSEDLFTWVPVITPWSGTYPPLEVVSGSPHDGSSGYIENMEYDPLTNTVICSGTSPETDSIFMMSFDGGLRWFEIGALTDYTIAAVAGGYEGIYNWPVQEYLGDHYMAWTVGSGGGLAYGYGWWFYINPSSPGDIYPAILRFSPDGKITEFVQPAQNLTRYSYIILAGGDVTF